MGKLYLIMKEYLKRKDFLKKARISKSKFYRDKIGLIDKYKHYEKPLFKKIVKEVKIHHILLQEYVDDYWVKLESLNNKQQNIINIFKNPNSIEKHLLKHDWKIFATVSPKHDWTEEQCRNQMSKLFELIKDINDEVKLFWTSEPFTNRSGYHNHFLIEFSDDNNYLVVKEKVKKYFKGNKVDVQKYDNTKLGAFYICKKGLNGESWDILY